MPAHLFNSISSDTETVLTIGVIVALAAVAMYGAAGTQALSGFAVAASANQTNVTLSVASTTSVTLEPGLYNFSKVTPGSTNFSSTNPSLKLIIANDGSSNITSVYAHTNVLQSEQDNPLGKGVADEHAAGKFLWIKNDTSSMYHAGFLSWNITQSAGGKPTGLNTGFGNPSKNSWGYYRNASGNYLWALNASTAKGKAYCNGTATELRMSNSVDTGSDRDLSGGGVTVYGGITGSSDIGYTNDNWAVVTGSGGTDPVSEGPLKGHYVAIHQSCEKFAVFRFDSDAGFGLTDTAHQYLVNSELTPGEEFTGRVGASLPTGIPAGQTNRTLITIYAAAAGG